MGWSPDFAKGQNGVAKVKQTEKVKGEVLPEGMEAPKLLFDKRTRTLLAWRREVRTCAACVSFT